MKIIRADGTGCSRKFLSPRIRLKKMDLFTAVLIAGKRMSYSKPAKSLIAGNRQPVALRQNPAIAALAMNIVRNEIMKTGATLNRGNSKQNYETPDNFITAVENRFEIINWDLAASKSSSRGQCWFDESQNSLIQDWNALRGNLWLNPPFDCIGKWAKKCSEYGGDGKILFLVPASVGSNWFRDYVFNRSHVLFLNGRITFKGCSTPYPKDTMLVIYNFGVGCSIWKWSDQTNRNAHQPMIDFRKI